MQETVLYTAKEQEIGLNWRRLLHWLDISTFIGVILAIGGVVGGATILGDVRAIFFVKMALLVMFATLTIFFLMLLVDQVGLWGLLGLVPIALGVILWASGLPAQMWVEYWGNGVLSGALHLGRYGFYAFCGIAGLGLLARVVEKVGVWGFLATLFVSTAIAIWVVI